MKYTVVPFILGIIVFQNSTRADETQWAQFLTLQHISLGLDVYDDGIMHLTNRHTEDFFGARFDAIDFFRHPSLLKELALSPAKEKQLLELCEQWESVQADARKQSGLDTTIKASELDTEEFGNNYSIWQKQVENFLKRQVKLTREFDEEIASLIGGQRHKRLRQIQLRYVLRLKGIVRILKSESNREMIGISSDPTNTIREVSPGIVTSTQHEIEKTVDDAHREWLKFLNGDARRQHESQEAGLVADAASVSMNRRRLPRG